MLYEYLHSNRKQKETTKLSSEMQKLPALSYTGCYDPLCLCASHIFTGLNTRDDNDLVIFRDFMNIMLNSITLITLYYLKSSIKNK